MLLAGAVLLGVVAIGTRRWWQDWLAARQAPQEPPRSDALRNRDERLKLALWASGEQFWDYDLVQRRLYRMRADETAVLVSQKSVTLSRTSSRVRPSRFPSNTRAMSS